MPKKGSEPKVDQGLILDQIREMRYGLESLTAAQIKQRFDELAVLAETPWNKVWIEPAWKAQNLTMTALEKAYAQAKEKEAARASALKSASSAASTLGAAINLLDIFWIRCGQESSEVYREVRNGLVTLYDDHISTISEADRQEYVK